MSLWLPRQSPVIIARSYNRSYHTLRPHLIASLIPRHSTHTRGIFPASRRLQSSSPPDGSSRGPESSVTDPNTTPRVNPSPPATKEAPKAPLSTRAWKKIKHEAAHYWHGTKLLVSEVRISSRLQWKILHGEALTRRERRQVRDKNECFSFSKCFYSCDAQHRIYLGSYRLQYSSLYRSWNYYYRWP
jgi:LETM1 and EF-hand domain-containing protein 1